MFVWKDDNKVKNSPGLAHFFKKKRSRAERISSGPVGRAVGSDTKGPLLKTYIEHLLTVKCIENAKVKKKRPQMGH